MLIVHITNTDPAGSVINFVNAMNAHTKHRARVITTVPIPAFDFPKDILDQYDGGDEVIALLEKADVIHFHKVDETFAFDLEFAAGTKHIAMKDFVAGKKLIYHIHGAPYERNFPQERATWFKEHNAKVLASTPDLEEVYRAFGADVSFFPNCVPINDVRYIPRACDTPIVGSDGKTKKYLVFQSATHSILKNMHVIRSVMDKLAKELPVAFLHTTPEAIQPLDFVLRHKRIAHIVFDHIEGYYGLSSLEGLSMGKPTIAGLSRYTMDAIKKFFGLEFDSDLPWVIARDAVDIEVQIRGLINNEDARLSAGRVSRKFMEEVWSDAAIARKLAETYESL